MLMSEWAPHSLCVLTWRKGTELSGVSFTTTLVSFMGASPSGPDHLPKTPLPNTTILGVRLQHMNSGEGGINIQSIAAGLQRTLQEESLRRNHLAFTHSDKIAFNPNSPLK